MITEQQLTEIQEEFGPIDEANGMSNSSNLSTMQQLNDDYREAIMKPQEEYCRYRDMTTAEMIGGTKEEKDRLFNRMVLKKLKGMNVDLLDALNPEAPRIVDAAKAVYNEEVARPLTPLKNGISIDD